MQGQFVVVVEGVQTELSLLIHHSSLIRWTMCFTHPQVGRLEAVLGCSAESVGGDVVALCELGGYEDAAGGQAVR